MGTKILRYECFRDPSDFWSIWDNLEGAPAENEMVTFVGMLKLDAETFCHLLNGLDGQPEKLVQYHR